jgi:hypothetical protein
MFVEQLVKIVEKDASLNTDLEKLLNFKRSPTIARLENSQIGRTPLLEIKESSTILSSYKKNELEKYI